jgi:diaminohydroxyphosphoribosylaminopyrimidine deaminase/5-amino-6-(5-phosphoribosylamino)uracil reductase
MQDPDERVRGRGFDALRAHGISVEVGLCRQEAERLNAPFVSVKIRQRPFVILKAATSIDGRISIVGQRTTLSSLAANRKTQQLRAAVDAIMIGSETALVDDPVLTVRDSQRVRPLVRVIIDRRLRLTAHARLFSTVGDGPVIILTSPTTLATAPAAVAALEAAGATVTAVDDLPQALGTLLDWDVSSVLVEGGARLQASFWSANLVDRLHLIVAPTALGESAVPLFAGRPIPRSMLTLTNVEARGADTWIEADVHRHH